MVEHVALARRPRRMTAQALIMLEVIVLGPVAAVLAFELIPHVFGLEWSCVGDYGVARTDGDSFAATVAVVGTTGWLFVLLATLFALIAERERLAAILPVVWFVVLIAGVTIAAAAVGPAMCPAG